MSENKDGNTGVTLVLGGTGKTGRRVVERLKARGLPVRVGSRSGEPPFDWEARDTRVPASATLPPPVPSQGRVIPQYAPR